MTSTRKLVVGGKAIPFTPRMYDGLSELAGGGDLAFEGTHVGRPTKQRLAKFGLAAFVTPKDWDGPMVLTETGRRVWARFGTEARAARKAYDNAKGGA